MIAGPGLVVSTKTVTAYLVSITKRIEPPTRGSGRPDPCRHVCAAQLRLSSLLQRRASVSWNAAEQPRRHARQKRQALFINAKLTPEQIQVVRADPRSSYQLAVVYGIASPTSAAFDDAKRIGASND